GAEEAQASARVEQSESVPQGPLRASRERESREEGLRSRGDAAARRAEAGVPGVEPVGPAVGLADEAVLTAHGVRVQPPRLDRLVARRLPRQSRSASSLPAACACESLPESDRDR